MLSWLKSWRDSYLSKPAHRGHRPERHRPSVPVIPANRT
jgi:hypothetical protein